MGIMWVIEGGRKRGILFVLLVEKREDSIAATSANTSPMGTSNPRLDLTFEYNRKYIGSHNSLGGGQNDSTFHSRDKRQ